ncbi:MAG: type I methionyl aminopeptidase [Spirochaetes bacterium GWD1_27_9]|nr:MAG: type I methionyl aminopeptidase [Spirochaetes bacterium GWB1_27_13]OHD27038.1 MAG: type I methionyl aminopeptidase [Spirochaetes bacterium GWC1_27_15]OHD40603.1 MAG: type I methionyl aminopeptidase [Spirochaetes bacterium GWD1_27_9]
MIYIKTKDEIERIRECGIISAMLFEYLNIYVQPGITTKELDRIAEAFIRRHNAVPSFKGYMDFPASICASVNEEVIHGLPCSRKLKEGDIIGIDVGIQKNGVISDSAKSYAVGRISKQDQDLLTRTELALYKGIAKVKNNCEINDIGGTILDYIKQFGYDVIKEYCGHGVGYKNHEEPEIPNYRYTKGKRKLKTGTVIAIEPMITLGQGEQFVLDDGWTVVTIDGKNSAHFEHTVAVTDNGFDILTVKPEDLSEIKKKFNL